ncbi:hypothetical protein [Streptomyces canus]
MNLGSGEVDVESAAEEFVDAPEGRRVGEEISASSHNAHVPS